MNRNRLMSSFVGTILIAASLVILPNSTANATEVSPAKFEHYTIENTHVARTEPGNWITVTPWPSVYGSLSGIAAEDYGNAGLWNVVYDANKDQISDPNVIYIDQRIFVPNLSSDSSTPQAPVQKQETSASWVHPLPNSTTTSCYGPRWGGMHKGIDYAAGSGTPIHAVGAGTVVVSGWNYSGYGISVVINHGNGYLSHYAHASKVAVGSGQYVEVDQVIAYVGSTGDSTGPHLHFEIHSGSMWNQINPAPWLRAHGVATGC